MNELSDDQLMLLKLMAEGGGGFLLGCKQQKAIREAVEEIEHLRAALSAAMQIIRRPGILMWGGNEARPDYGYWVRINNDWQFSGPELMDAINLLNLEKVAG